MRFYEWFGLVWVACLVRRTRNVHGPPAGYDRVDEREPVPQVATRKPGLVDVGLGGS